MNDSERKKSFVKVFEHSIFIPVTTINAKEFTTRKSSDPYHPVDIAEQIAAKITDYFNAHTSLKIPKGFDNWLGELVENSYDAFAKRGLTIGHSLLFKIVIKKSDSNLIVSIKDNAGGFCDKVPGQHFGIEDIQSEGKEEHYFIGGVGIGLTNLNTYLLKHNIQLFFKNRGKENGTTVSMFFNPTSLTPS
ncbi:ATP-binding protein [Legionella bononiensis]|nr:ATP-binding protein [Legionella bononiensis]MBL7563826.1 ATP-binding protein [Legionella bononiensis]